MKRKFAYTFDNIMSKGTLPLVALLAIATLLLVGLISLIIVLLGWYPPTGELPFAEVFWAGLLRTLDAGTMGGDQGFGFRAAMFIVTLAGVILVASLIGIISNAFNTRIEKLRKGKSIVLEVGHTLVLGWNSKILNLIHEISLANDSRKRAVIVVLANRDKVEMEDELRHKLKDLGRTRLIVRSGDPMSHVDLQICRPETARSVVVLADEQTEDPDSASIKVSLAIQKIASELDMDIPVVGEIHNPENMEAARLVGGNSSVWILTSELISRLIVQTSRQRGLSLVFTDLLDFEGSEIYPVSSQGLVGARFQDAQLSFTRGVLIGIIDAQNKPFLNPPADFKIDREHRLLVICEDDSQIRFSSRQEFDETQVMVGDRPEPTKENVLIIGLNGTIETVLTEMNDYLVPGSSVTVVSQAVPGALSKFSNIEVELLALDSTKTAQMEKLDLASYAHVILLSEHDTYATQEADARTLLALLHLRAISKARGLNLNVVSEMLDDRNRELAETASVDDFIVSDKLVGLMLAQVEQNQELAYVFDELFSSRGSEIRLHPVEWYVPTGVPVTFNTLVRSASEQGDAAFGVLTQTVLSTKKIEYRLVLSPDRAEAFTYQPGDKLAVLTTY